jgi:hypothetical protein
MFTQVEMIWIVLRAGIQTLKVRDERGSAVETVILTAIFAALAISVGLIIVNKVTSKAHTINLNN